MRNDINDLKKLTLELMEGEPKAKPPVKEDTKRLIKELYSDVNENLVEIISPKESETYRQSQPATYTDNFQDAITVDEPVSLQDRELEMIKQALERNHNKRKLAAKELGISERTLYRKIKQYDL